MDMDQLRAEPTGFETGIRQFFRFLPLLWELVKRDFKAKYKRSNLGILWTVLQPLATMAVMSIIFSTLFHRDIANFPVYLICGQLIFSFHSEATSMSMRSLIGGRMLFNARLPVYMIPLSRVLSSLINALLSLIALTIVAAVTGVKPTLTMLLFPLPFLYTFMFAFGVGMLLSVGMVFFQDLSHLYGILTTLWMYCTPIFYPDSIYPEKYAYIFHMNPLYHFVQMFRSVILYGTTPPLQEHLICLSYGVVAILIGTMVMHRNKNKITSQI